VLCVWMWVGGCCTGVVAPYLSFRTLSPRAVAPRPTSLHRLVCVCVCVLCVWMWVGGCCTGVVAPYLSFHTLSPRAVAPRPTSLHRLVCVVCVDVGVVWAWWPPYLSPRIVSPRAVAPRPTSPYRLAWSQARILNFVEGVGWAERRRSFYLSAFVGNPLCKNSDQNSQGSVS